MSEKEFQTEVINILKLHGFTKIYHTFDSRKSEPGFPDILAIRPEDGYQVAWELKTDKGKCTDAQAEWLEAFESVRRHNVAVHRPCDMEEMIKKVRLECHKEEGK